MALYGCVLFEGAGLCVDKDRGEQLLQRSKHMIARAYCVFCGIGVDGDEDKAYRLLSTECDTADPHVQYLLSYFYLYGWGCVRSSANGVQCCERAGNHVGALYNLGYMFANGLGVERDYAQAAVLHRRAAEQGHREAQYSIGGMYEAGRGVPLDLQQAQYWYALAVQQDIK
eukprot:TRINITY_DN4413_c0_g1_i1.p2 TRINITY_DN4413_c0_g1~~TRINITY_DN4413_c0_g1_i1.p2  ORF type:complete len:196 (-),score=44.47 TRINITY_DN4413_c0_g1_i1:195-707(-)